MRYLRVKNFAKFQHYKTRHGQPFQAPPWIKLYSGVLQDDAITSLPERVQRTLMWLWLLAANKKNNLIRYNPIQIKMDISAKKSIKRDIDLLISAGFLEVVSLDKSLENNLENNLESSLEPSLDKVYTKSRAEVEVYKEEEKEKKLLLL